MGESPQPGKSGICVGPSAAGCSGCDLRIPTFRPDRSVGLEPPETLASDPSGPRPTTVDEVAGPSLDAQGAPAPSGSSHCHRDQPSFVGADDRHAVAKGTLCPGSQSDGGCVGERRDQNRGHGLEVVSVGRAYAFSTTTAEPSRPMGVTVGREQRGPPQLHARPARGPHPRHLVQLASELGLVPAPAPELEADGP